MRIRLEIPDVKVPGLAVGFGRLTSRLDPEDNGGRVETDAELILRYLTSYIVDQELVGRQRAAQKAEGRDETIVTATDVTP